MWMSRFPVLTFSGPLLIRGCAATCRGTGTHGRGALCYRVATDGGGAWYGETSGGG